MDITSVSSLVDSVADEEANVGSASPGCTVSPRQPQRPCSSFIVPSGALASVAHLETPGTASSARLQLIQKHPGLHSMQ